MFGPPPPMPGVGRNPGVGSNPGVGRPPGSSTEGLYVRVSGSPVGAPSPGVSPISVRGSLGSSPQSWPSPPPKPRSRARSVSRRGTRIETNEPETGTPGGNPVTAKPKRRPVGSKSKPK